MLLNPEDGDSAAIIRKRGLGDREGEGKLDIKCETEDCLIYCWGPA